MNECNQGVWRIHKIPILLLIGVIVVIILFAVGFAAWGDGMEGITSLHTDVTTLENGWSDEEGNSISLPAKLPYQPDGYHFSTVLRPEDTNSNSLLFSAKYLNVRLYVDGEELGSCLCRLPGQNKTQGKTFTLFMLPEGGGTLRMEAEPVLDADVRYEITAPRIGSGGALVYQLISDELPILVISSVIFCFGLFLLIYGVQALHALVVLGGSRTFQVSFLYIGVFAVLFSLYSLVITDSVHLFVANSYFIYLLEFLLLALLPLPLLALAAKACTDRFQPLLLADCCAVFLNFSFQAVLHFSFGLELKDAVIFTHLLMAASILLLVPALMSAGSRKKECLRISVSFIPVVAGAVLDIFRYYMPGSYQKVRGFQLGVLMFLLFQATVLIRQNLEYYEDNIKLNAYRQMAYTDAMTGLFNRTAFEEELTGMQEKLDNYSDIWCISADINNLKKTNDTLGHAAGDELIRGTAGILQTAGSNIQIYRIGGDEFVLLLINKTEQEVRLARARLNAAVRQYNASHGNPLSIAIGCDRFRFSDGDTLTKLLSRADAMMYQDKQKWKETEE